MLCVIAVGIADFYFFEKVVRSWRCSIRYKFLKFLMMFLNITGL